jgi:hypothetical protein
LEVGRLWIKYKEDAEEVEKVEDGLNMEKFRNYSVGESE